MERRFVQPLALCKVIGYRSSLHSIVCASIPQIFQSNSPGSMRLALAAVAVPSYDNMLAKTTWSSCRSSRTVDALLLCSILLGYSYSARLQIRQALEAQSPN